MIIEFKIILLASLVWFCCPAVIAQEPPVETSISDAQETIIEEITVIGQQLLYSLKFEAIRAEDLKFELFNSLNSTDDFDITCEMRAPINSHIKRRFCDVNYMKEAQADDVRDFLNFGGWIRSDLQLAVEFTSKTKALNKEMIDLAVKHPELATAMIRAHELKQRYHAERREKFKDSIFIGHPEPEENIVDVNELGIWEIAFLDHKSGAMTEEIWDGWDRWYKTLFHKESYRTLWASSNRENYTEEFIEYVNAIISEE